MPERIQLQRRKGWRLPPGARNVARPTKFGNPFRVGAPHPRHGWPMSPQEAVDEFRRALLAGELDGRFTVDDVQAELVDRDLACWCREGAPCHGSVLIEFAAVYSHL